MVLGARIRDPGSETVLAVLPFENLSGDDATEPFVLGVNDDLLTHLSQIGTIKLISRTSVMGYEESTKTIPEIAEELGATTVLEGGIQRSGDRIRVNVQLIDAQTDEHLWAEQFDRTLTAEDVFAIQGEIAGRIAEALATELTPEEKADLASAPTKNLEALDLYYQGLAYYQDRNAGENSRRAEAALASAVEADPEFAAAWAALAQARAWRLRVGATTDAQGVRVATLYILTGDRDAAFRVLDTLASIPSFFSAASLRLDPTYDSLRDDPRYANLLRKLEAAERISTGTR